MTKPDPILQLADQREILEAQIKEYESDIRMKEHALVQMRVRLTIMTNNYYRLVNEKEKPVIDNTLT